jgi:hypothetical protein
MMFADLALALLITTHTGAQAGAAGQPQIIVDNHVSSCLRLDGKRLHTTDSLVILSVNGTFLKSTGECGCTSALLEYTVSSGEGEKRMEWVRALVFARPPKNNLKTFDFVVKSDSTLPPQSPLTLDVQCAPH